jgi:hypothetical protein
MKKSNSPHNGERRTPGQRRAWGAFGGASRGWDKVTEEQRRAWDEAAKKEKRRRRWPASRRFTGQNLFTEINANQAFLGLPPFLDPPDHPAFDADLLGPLIISDGSDGFTIKLSVPNPPAGHVLVYGARPCNAGRRYCDKLIYLGLLPAPVGGWSDITKLYCEMHGVPWAGSRVIIATRQQINGWRDLLMRTDGIVPHGQGLLAKPKRRRTTVAAS